MHAKLCRLLAYDCTHAHASKERILLVACVVSSFVLITIAPLLHVLVISAQEIREKYVNSPIRDLKVASMNVQLNSFNRAWDNIKLCHPISETCLSSGRVGEH